MNRIPLYLGLMWVIGICFLGMFAALIRWHALDDWCANQLEAGPRQGH